MILPDKFVSVPRQSIASMLSMLMFASIALFGSSACSKEKVAVPNVMKQDVEQAKKTIESVSLKIGNIAGVSGTPPPGAYVVAQTPQPGEQIDAESAVDLTIQAPVEVPDLVDTTVVEAVNVLQGVGLKVALMKQPSLPGVNILRGPRVIRQDPTAKTLVHQDAIVTLTVEAPPNLGILLGRVRGESAYGDLKPEYREALDQFMNQTDSSSSRQ